MKIFISWSGDPSKKVAEAMGQFLRRTIQAAEPWISTLNIEKGSLWDPVISQELGSSPIGIIVLTKENLQAPWILFEAGALYKGGSTNRVCTFLVGLEYTDVKQPLAKFNHTLATAEDTLKLLNNLNAWLPKPLEASIIEEAFANAWPRLEAEIKAAANQKGKSATREPDDLLREILETVRRLDSRPRPAPDELTNLDPKRAQLNQLRSLVQMHKKRLEFAERRLAGLREISPGSSDAQAGEKYVLQVQERIASINAEIAALETTEDLV